MATLRASQLQRLNACPGSFALPQYPRESGAAAVRGTAIHAYLEQAATDGREAALAAIEDPAIAAAAAAIPLDLLPTATGSWTPEVALALNPKTGEAIEPKPLPGGGYDIPPGFIAGTTDALRFDPATGTVFIVDWKTGREVTPAAANLQLKFYGLAAARKFKAGRAVLVIAYLWGDRIRVDRAEMDALDLDIAEGYLSALVDRLLAQDPQAPALTLGEHCRYCPALPGCPARLDELRALAGDPGRLLGGLATPGTDLGLIGRAWSALARLEAAIDTAKETIRLLAESAPIPLPSGKVLTAVEASRETLAPLAARAALLEILGEAGANIGAPMEPSASKTSVRAAVKATLKPGEKLGARYEAVLKALADAGAVKTAYYSKVTEVDAKDLETTDGITKLKGD